MRGSFVLTSPRSASAASGSISWSHSRFGPRAGGGSGGGRARGASPIAPSAAELATATARLASQAGRVSASGLSAPPSQLRWLFAPRARVGLLPRRGLRSRLRSRPRSWPRWSPRLRSSPRFWSRSWSSGSRSRSRAYRLWSREPARRSGRGARTESWLPASIAARNSPAALASPRKSGKARWKAPSKARVRLSAAVYRMLLRPSWRIPSVALSRSVFRIARTALVAASPSLPGRPTFSRISHPRSARAASALRFPKF
mmetsp:Transcript_17860/g.40912  ORF Transcript_17860/g.40912 Transcript_17860/m.40912 type:complete len:258 (+) Transcript_17860:706-1479(+)